MIKARVWLSYRVDQTGSAGQQVLRGDGAAASGADQLRRTRREGAKRN